MVIIKPKSFPLPVILIFFCFALLLMLVSCANQKNLKPSDIVGWGIPPTDEQVQASKFTPEAKNIQAKAMESFNNSMRAACKKNNGWNALQIAINSLKNDPYIKAISYQSKSINIYDKNNGMFGFFADSYARVKDATMCDGWK